MQLGILVRASDGLGKVGLLLVGQVAPDTGNPGKDAGQGLHIALCIVDVHAIVCQLVTALFCVGGKAGKDGVQGCASLAALNTCIGHGSQNCGGFLDRVAEGGGGGCTRLVCLAQLDHIRVGVSHSVGHHINKVCGVRGFQAESGQVVGNNVGCLRQVHVGGSSQIQHRADALQHGLGVPACQSHVRQSVRRFTGGELGGCAHLLGLVGQRFQLIAGCAGQGFDVAHGCFKITCGVDAVHVCVFDFAEGFCDASRGKHRFNGIEGFDRFLTEALCALSGLVHGLFEVNLLVFQLIDLGFQPSGFCCQLRGVHASFPQSVPGGSQTPLIGVQGGRGLVDLRLLGNQLVFQRRGIALGLLNLFLDVIVLLLQDGQPLLGGANGLLLLLVRGYVGLYLVQLLDSVLCFHKSRLCSLEGAGEVAVLFGGQVEQQLPFFSSHYFAFLAFSRSATMALLVSIHCRS